MEIMEDMMMEDDHYTKVSARYMKEYRKEKWKKINNWEEDDLDRKVDSLEARPEQLQDFEKKMVIIGSDVIALYPNLDIRRVVENVKEAVKKSGTTWREIDYLEGVRYLALNWSSEECARSRLRRILPRRKGTRGSRPTVRGQGPKGRERGDQEQWTFPKIVLEDWEKEEIISEVVSLATAAMFRNHYYSFGGKVFHQESGGPIGLRGTCSIARLVMQLYDTKWTRRMEELGITIWLMMRYMDDTRILLPEIKPGWRWEEGKVIYCKRWEEEDSALSGIERTKRLILESLKGIESYLDFTVETGEDKEFLRGGGWQCQGR